MNEPTDWEKYVSHTYATVVGESDPKSGINRQPAFDLAEDRLLEAIRAGEIEVDLHRVIRHSLDAADKAHGSRGDKLIARTVAGELSLFSSDEDLNTVVILGDGRRKIWRYVRLDDLISMDDIRYRNVRAQQESYDAWREAYVRMRDALRAHGTVEDALTADYFGRPQAA